MKNQPPISGSRDRLGEKVTQGAKRRVAGIANYDVVEDFDFQKLAGSNEITGDSDVRFRWS